MLTSCVRCARVCLCALVPIVCCDTVIDSIRAAINHRSITPDRTHACARTHTCARGYAHTRATDVNMTRPDVCVCLMFHDLSRWDGAGNDQEMRQDERWGKYGGKKKKEKKRKSSCMSLGVVVNGRSKV